MVQSRSDVGRERPDGPLLTTMAPEAAPGELFAGDAATPKSEQLPSDLRGFFRRWRHSDLQAFLGQAVALLFPVDWPEPFGLVMIEAIACGTPVIALNRGSVSEVIRDGVSGFIADTVDEAIAAVRRVGSIDRAKVRAEFEQRFTAECMAREYLHIYETLAGARVRSAQQRCKTSSTPDLRSLKRGEPSVMPKAIGASEIVIDGHPNGLPKTSERAGQKRRVSRLTAGSPRARPRTSKTPSSDEPRGAS